MGSRLKRVRNGVYKSVGTQRTVYVGVRSRRVVFAREEAAVQELLEDRGTPWLNDRDASVVREVPLDVGQLLGAMFDHGAKGTR